MSTVLSWYVTFTPTWCVPTAVPSGIVPVTVVVYWLVASPGTVTFPIISAAVAFCPYSLINGVAWGACLSFNGWALTVTGTFKVSTVLSRYVTFTPTWCVPTAVPSGIVPVTVVVYWPVASPGTVTFPIISAVVAFCPYSLINGVAWGACLSFNGWALTVTGTFKVSTVLSWYVTFTPTWCVPTAVPSGIVPVTVVVYWLVASPGTVTFPIISAAVAFCPYSLINGVAWGACLSFNGWALTVTGTFKVSTVLSRYVTFTPTWCVPTAVPSGIVPVTVVVYWPVASPGTVTFPIISAVVAFWPYSLINGVAWGACLSFNGWALTVTGTFKVSTVLSW